MLFKIISAAAVVVFLATAVIWTAQSYAPLRLVDGFSTETCRVGHVVEGYRFGIKIVSSPPGASVGTTVLEDGFRIDIPSAHQQVLPASGTGILWEIARGRLFHIQGTIARVQHPQEPEKYACSLITITSRTAYPLWPLLVASGAITGLFLYRWSSRHRRVMLEAYRAAKLRKTQLAVSCVLFCASVGLYLAQLSWPVTLYNGLHAPDEHIALNRAMGWDVKRVMDTKRYIGVSTSSTGATLYQEPAQAEDYAPAPGEYALVVVGGDALRLLRTTATVVKAPAVPDQVWHSLSTPAAVLSLPLWLGIAGFGAWFGYLAFMPSWAYLKRRRLGLCLCCGYDLRGQAEPRCPECGSPNSPIPSPDSSGKS